MIKSIKLKNYETHLNTKFDLHPGVNIFTGESDEGKSGIVRAIELNAKNRPLGDEYRNDQLGKEDKKEKAQVIIDYKGTGIITRERDDVSGGINHYKINDQEPLRALRTDVPDEVKEITLMDDVNIQGQHPTEQYFLLAEKPGKVAKEFNKVAGLTIMDDATADINKQVRSCNGVVKVAKKEIETRTDELEDTKWVPKAKKLADKLQKFQLKIDAKEIEHKKIVNLVTQIKKIDMMLKEFDGIEDALKEIELLETAQTAIQNKRDTKYKLDSIIHDLNNVNTELDTIQYTDKALIALKSLENEFKEIQSNELKLKAINSLVVQINTNSGLLEEASKELHEAEKQHDIIYINYGCPVCGRKGKQ